MLLFHCPGVAKLPANAKHKLRKHCVSLSCFITMLLSYLLSQFPIGYWLEYLKNELSSLLGYMRKMLSRLPEARINFAICAQSNPTPTPTQDKPSLWMETTFSQTVIIFHSCYRKMTRLLPLLSFQRAVLLSVD